MLFLFCIIGVCVILGGSLLATLIIWLQLAIWWGIRFAARPAYEVLGRFQDALLAQTFTSLLWCWSAAAANQIGIAVFFGIGLLISIALMGILRFKNHELYARAPFNEELFRAYQKVDREIYREKLRREQAGNTFSNTSNKKEES